MADVSSLLQAAANLSVPSIPVAPTASPFVPAFVPEVKQAEVASASDQKKLEMGGLPSDQTFLNAYIARTTGSGLETSTNPIEHDLATLSADEIYAKYGQGQGQALLDNFNSVADRFRAKGQTMRIGGEPLWDTATGIGLGAVNSLGGLGALGAGLVSNKAGAFAADSLQKLNDAVQNSQSPTLRAHRDMYAEQAALDARDEAKTYADDKATYGAFHAGLAHVGREALNTAAKTINDPTLLQDTVAQAAGSILTSAPIAKGLGLISKAILPAAARGSIAANAAIDSAFSSPSVSRGLAAIGERLPSSMMTSVGLQEAGGAYQGSAADVAAMTPEQLETSSPYYRELRQQGMSAEDAQAKVANRAGLLAAAVAGPAGMLAGRVSEKYLEHPFTVNSLGHAGSNILKETAEEALQGASGQVAQNVGEKAYADPTKDLLEGVGEQVALGALGGGLSAAGTQAPGIALHGVKAAGRAAVNAVLDRVGTLGTKNAAASNVSDARVADIGSELSKTTNTPEMKSTLDDAVQHSKVDDPTNPAMERMASNILSLANVDHEEVDTSPLPEADKLQVKASGDRISFMQKLADVVNSKGTDHEDGASAALGLYDQVQQFHTLLSSDQNALTDVPDDHPANAVVEKWNDLDARIEQSPSIRKALSLADQITQEQSDKLIKPVTEESLNTPEGQKNIQNAVALAALAPDRANLAVNKMILPQVAAGKIQLTPDQHQALQTSISIMKAAQQATDKWKNSGQMTPLNSVTEDIMTKPGQRDDPQRSAVAFAKRIQQAMRAGNVTSAGADLGELGKFTQHMQNKVQAFNESYAGAKGKNVPYQALNSESRTWYLDKKGLATHPTQPGSVGLAQRVGLEANRLAQIYNGLTKTYPSLNAATIQPTELHPNLQGKVSEVVQAHKDGSLKPSSLAQTPVTEETKTNAPVGASSSTGPIAADSDRPSRSSEISHSERSTGTESIDSGETRNAPPAVSENDTGKAKKAAPAVATPVEEAEPQAKLSDAGAKAQETPKAPEAGATPALLPEQSQGAEAPKTVEEAYPNLADKRKLFHKAFNIAKTGSRIFNDANPLKTLKDALESRDSLQNFMGGKRRAGLKPAIAKAYQGYLNLVPAMRKTLNDRLAAKLAQPRESGKFAGKSMADLLEGGQFTNFPEGKAATIAEKQADGSFKYNQTLADQALIAGLQWLLVSDNYRSEMDEDLVHALTGIPKDKVSDTTVEMLRPGLSPVEAVRSLADKIVDFWGLEKNNSYFKDSTDGIAHAMAAEVLMTLAETKLSGDEGLLKIEHFIVEGNNVRPLPEGEDTQKRTLQRLIRDMVTETKGKPKPLFVDPTVLEEAVLQEPKDKLYYGGDTLPKATAQMRNPLVDLTSSQKKMVETHQAQPYFVNVPFFNLVAAIGLDGYKTLFGGGDTEKRALNAAHKVSLEGKNKSVVAALTSLSARIEQMRGFDTPIEETPIHYPFGVSSVGRLQMQGGQNPQGSKDIREAILPTWSTIDLSKDEDSTLFKTAIAQALGVKIHAKDTASILKDVTVHLDKNFTDTLDMLSAQLEGQRLPSDFVERVQHEFRTADVELTQNALHALQEYARSESLGDDAQKSFRTALYIEADGVTNGIVNAINMLTASRSFTPDQIENMKKGGRFFTGSQTMNEYRATPEGSIDLYKVGSNKTQSGLNKLFLHVSTPVAEQMNHLLGLMQLFVPKFDFDPSTGNVTLDRGLTKNPMTITVYGSGANGIAGNVANMLADSLYEGLSKVAQARQSDKNAGLETLFDGDKAKLKTFSQALKALLTSVPQVKEGQLSLKASKASAPSTLNPLSFTLENEQFEALQENVLHLLVNPMRTAITETMGESLMGSAKLLQSATQAQSIVLEQMFKDQVAAVKAENGGRFPSENQLTRITRGLLKIAPLIDTGDQKFFPVKNDSSDFADNLGRGLNNELKTPAQVYGPSNAGVKGLPMLNIGMGDGHTVQGMTHLGATGLPVFDGWNFALDRFRKGSQIANQAVYESWQNSPLAATLDSYSVFMSNMNAELIGKTPGLLKALAEALLPRGERENASTLQIMDALKSFHDQLTESAKIVDARHQVMDEHRSHTDQMAGGQSPHVHEGIVLSGSSADVSGAFNTRMDEVLNGVKPEVSSIAPVKVLGVRSVGSEIKFAPEQAKVWNQILRVGALDNFSIVRGTIEQIAARRAEGNLSMPEGLSTAQGFIDVRNKTIYLASSSPETLLHEAIHAATFNAVLTHYEGGNLGANASTIRDAVACLEALMQQFLELDPTDRPNSFYDASRAVRENLNKGDPVSKAKALNEFMAWTLANKELTKLFKTTKAVSLAQMAKDVWAQIKRIVFGNKSVSQVRDDMFSNLLFNSAIIIQEQPSIADLNRDTMLLQNKAYGNDQRLADLNSQFDQIFGRFLKTGDPLRDADRQREQRTANIQATDLAILAEAQGFAMTPQASTTFDYVVQALALQIKLEPTALTAMDELYRHAMKVLKPEDLIDKSNLNPQAAYSDAKSKFDLLVGHAGKRSDAYGRSSLLPVFMGLGLVDDGLRAALRDIPVPKSEHSDEKTFDAKLTNLATKTMDALAEKISGQSTLRNKPLNIKEAIDQLTSHVASSALDRESYVEMAVSRGQNQINSANDMFVSWMEGVSDKTIAKMQDVSSKTKNPTVKRLADFTELMAEIATEKNAGRVAESVLTGINHMKGFVSFREAVSEIIGRTESNAAIFDLIKLVKSMVEKTRQQFREHLPETILSQFSKKPSDAELSALHMAMGKSDIASHTDHRSNQEILELLADKSKRKALISTLEDTLKTADPAHWSLVQAKSQQLAKFMMTGEHGNNLLRNAKAVASLLGEKKDPSRKAPLKAYVQGVDQLVSLYALGHVSQEMQGPVSLLVQNEPKAMNYLLSYLTGQRKTEQQKADGMAKFNSYKGYIPSLAQDGVSLLVADDSQSKDLLEKSYVRLGDYEGSKVEVGRTKKGYYFSPVSGRSAFNQGILQNVRQTSGGVELSTGYTEGLSAGVIKNRGEVASIARILAREGATKENLLPVYNENGKVVAFERAVDPSRLKALNQDTNIAKMIGVWRGRQVEEGLSQQFNTQLVDKLHSMYDKAGDKKAYVDLFDPKSYGSDPVIRDAVSLMNDETKDYIREKFGDKFMVRRDLINDTVGYRQASLGDPWTGNSRWRPEVQLAIKNLSLAVFGNNAYRYLVASEENWKGLVKDAKNLIVVKSIIVPMANFAANMFQLIGRGVSITDIMKNMPKKLVEARLYEKGAKRKIDAEADLRVAEGEKNFNAQHKLKAEIQAIEDGWKRLSIWPLIEVGELSSIAGNVSSGEGTLLGGGKLDQFLTGLVKQLPTSVQTAGRYAVIAKDTPLYQGLQKSVEYGDFLAKAVYYDHLTQRRGLSSAQALAKVTEEYIHLDRLPGRSRSYLDTVGLEWFFNYKIRSAKLAISMIRDNPLQALLATGLNHVSPIPVDTAFHDNIISKVWNGSILNSMNPLMILRAPMLNPVAQVLF